MADELVLNVNDPSGEPTRVQLTAAGRVPIELTTIAAPANLDDIGDVNVAGAVALDILQFDGANWINQTPAQVADDMNLGELGDVVLTAPAADAFLQFDGANWINQTPAQVAPEIAAALSLGDLSDVDTAGAGAGDILIFNGATWEDMPASALAPAIDHGLLLGLADDDHLQYALLAGRAGGQTLVGGTAPADALTLRGSSDALFGDINIEGEVIVSFDPTGTGLTHFFNVIPTYTGAAGLNGGFNYSPNITVTSAVSIIEAIRGLPTITQEAATTFSAFTLFQALPIVRTVNAAFNPMQALILNAGPTNEVSGAIAPPANPSLAGMNFAPQVRALTAGGTSSVTSINGVQVSPVWSTVAGSTATMGTVTGMRVNDTAAALFQPVLGTETISNYLGLDVANLGVFAPVSGTVAAVRSAITSGAGRFFLQNTSTAQSDFGSSSIRFNDLNGVIFGTSDDLNMGWGAANFLFFQFNALSDQLRISNPSADRFLFNDATGAGEFNFNCLKFSLGAQTGAVGNQKGAFVSGAETITVAGEYSQFLLTQAANDTVDSALSLYAGWTINSPTPVIGAGSVTTAVGLNVGGNPSVGTNRAGVRIISNPSGGAGVNAALWVTAGLSRFDGRVDINNGIALGGGAVATLGTIGGAGPTAAAQAQWVEIDIGGVAHWIPVWT